MKDKPMIYSPQFRDETRLDKVAADFRKQYDELGLKSPKNSMPGLERELIIDYWLKVIRAEQQEAAITEIQLAWKHKKISTQYFDERLTELEKPEVS